MDNDDIISMCGHSDDGCKWPPSRQHLDEARADEIAPIKAIYDKYRKEDEQILKEEPCCAQNTQNMDVYCSFHSLMNELGKILDKK